MLKAQFLRKQDLKRLSEAEKQQGRFRKEREATMEADEVKLSMTRALHSSRRK